MKKIILLICISLFSVICISSASSVIFTSSALQIFFSTETTNDNVIWKDNCQIRCIDNRCNKIIGRTFYANDTDGMCKPIEQAKSLKNSPIKCVIESDEIHKVDCLDYNLTSMRLKLDYKGDFESEVKIEDGKIKDKIRIVSYVFNESTELMDRFEIEQKIELEYENSEVTPLEYIIFDVDLFSKEIHFGENSTTIKLQDADTENLEDVFGVTGGPQGALIDAVTWIKFNISSVPLGQAIDDSQFCVYVITSGAGWDGDVYFANVNNQTWVETDSAAILNSLSISDEETESFFATSTGWDCVNVTTQVIVDYDTNDYSSLKLWDPDHNQTAPSLTSSAASLRIGEQFNFGCSNCYIVFDGKESATPAQRPYLNITYSEAPPADSCTYSSGNWQINHNCNITNDNDIGGNDVFFNCSDYVSITGNITNFGVARSYNGCRVTASGEGHLG